MVHCWVTSLKLNQEEANVTILFVRQNVKELVFVIVDDLGDAQDVEQLVQINIMILFCIYPETVVQRSNCEDVLINVGDKVAWLNSKFFRKLVYGLDFLSFEIQFENDFLFSEYNGGDILSWLRMFKDVLHAHLIEHGEIFHDYPLVQYKLLRIIWFGI